MSTHILRRILIVSLGVALIALSDLAAQEAGVEQPDEPVVFTADAVARTTKAINYRSRGGKTKVIFDGTALAKYASGEATVRNKGGRRESTLNYRGCRTLRGSARSISPTYSGPSRPKVASSTLASCNGTRGATPSCSRLPNFKSSQWL